MATKTNSKGRGQPRRALLFMRQLDSDSAFSPVIKPKRNGSAAMIKKGGQIGRPEWQQQFTLYESP
jgi:hypothetical protein